MRPAGHETLELWRESGEWWANEQPREFESYIDEKGIRKVEWRGSNPTYTHHPTSVVGTSGEDYTEEIALQKAARRMRGWGEYSRPGFYESYKAKDARRIVKESVSVSIRSAAPAYVPLHIFSGFAFGRALIHASDIPAFAAMRGLYAAALVDPFSLVGAFEFAKAAKKVGIKPLIGASFELDSSTPSLQACTGGSLVLIARSKRGYQSLSKLITRCHLEEPRLYPLCRWSRLRECSRDLICLTGGDGGPINQLLTHGDHSGAAEALEELIAIYGRENVFVEIERCFVPWERRVNRLLLELASRYDLIPVAGGLVCHESPEHYPAQDVLVCSETLCLVEEIIGRKPSRDESQPQIKCRPARHLNAERYLRSAEEMAILFGDAPYLLENTRRVSERCDQEVFPGRTRLPQQYEDDNFMLYQVTWDGAKRRHRKITRQLTHRLEHELNRIASLGYSGHFLTIWNTCEWAREQQILFSGRGSVVDSAVAYCLGLSRIDAFEHKLHFDRFLPADGSKRPDIDIDFEAHRRDDIRNYLRRKYGEEHVATVAAVGTYGTRGIIREVGKAMGLPDPIIGQFAKLIHGGVSPEYLETALDTRPELRDSGVPREKFKWIMDLAPLIADMPRNIRAHSSGVVISDEPLYHTVPVMLSGAEDVPIIQWDKRTAKHFFDKFDILCLRGQDVLSGTQARIRVQSKVFDVEQISLKDEETYRTMRSGALIGIPQSASPAMRQAHIRLRTGDLHDASLVQAGIRPGVGGAVKLNELIARRRGKPYTFLHPKFEEILGLTYGIIVFQEQVDQLLQTFGGYSCGEAEAIREAIHENRKRDYGQEIREDLYQRITSNDFSREIADHVFDLVAGFKGYGFAQGHALAFAEVSIRSIYCQQNYPAEYFASLLDAQPAGYYGPCTLVNEARCRGVAILPLDVNRSELKFKVEDVKAERDPKIIIPNGGIRVALTQIGGLSKEARERIVKARCSLTTGDTESTEAHGGGMVVDWRASNTLHTASVEGSYSSFFDFVLRINPDRDELERLILCGAFDSLHPNRRALLWSIPKAYDYAESSRAMSEGLGMTLPEPEIDHGIEDFLEHEKALYERAILGLDVKHHLMAFERERVSAKGVVLGSEIEKMKSGEQAIVVGNPIRLRFPPTASGKRVVFFDLEDESGLLNVTCFDDVYRRDGHAIVTSAYVTIRGEAQDRDGHMAFLAHRIYPYKPKLNLEGVAHVDKLFETADFLAK